MTATTDLGAEVAAITAVLTGYLDGLHHSDADGLAEVFHPHAVYASATAGTLTHLTMDRYLPMVADRPSPASRGEARTDEIVAVELVGPVTAVARVRCSIGPRRFTDVLSLVHLDGRWRIIAKVFHYESVSEGV